MVELRAISPDASPEEVAAIVAALAEVERQRRAQAMAATVAGGQQLDHWRFAGRLASRRAGMTRGPWRLSGRIRSRPHAS